MSTHDQFIVIETFYKFCMDIFRLCTATIIYIIREALECESLSLSFPNINFRCLLVSRYHTMSYDVNTLLHKRQGACLWIKINYHSQLIPADIGNMPISTLEPVRSKVEPPRSKSRDTEVPRCYNYYRLDSSNWHGNVSNIEGGSLLDPLTNHAINFADH